MAASVRIEDEAFSDQRYVRLATLCGLADADHARGKMLILWRQCTLEQRYVLPVEDVVAVLGPSGEKNIVTARLGVTHPRGIRIAGTRGRIEWLKNLRENGKKGGRPKKPKGLASGSAHQNPPAPAPAPVTAPVKKETPLPPLLESLPVTPGMNTAETAEELATLFHFLKSGRKPSLEECVSWMRETVRAGAMIYDVCQAVNHSQRNRNQTLAMFGIWYEREWPENRVAMPLTDYEIDHGTYDQVTFHRNTKLCKNPDCEKCRDKRARGESK